MICYSLERFSLEVSRIQRIDKNPECDSDSPDFYFHFRMFGFIFLIESNPRTNLQQAWLLERTPLATLSVPYCLLSC